MTGADTSSLLLGAVYTSELAISFLSLVDANGQTIVAKDFDRYLLYGAEIDLWCVVSANTENHTWDAVGDLTWDDVAEWTWEDLCGEWEIPIGLFTVAETQRNTSDIQIKAYDHLSWFDKSYTGKKDNDTMLPFDWLSEWCTACDVPLGMTRADVYSLPNGTNAVALAQVTDDITSYRDAISYLSAAMCSIATMDRRGQLILVPFKMDGAMDIPASWRWDCKAADYESMYDGLYATYKAGALTEYIGDSSGTNLVYNLGTNPFLQVSDSSRRHTVLDNIYKRLSTIRYTPFSGSAPLDPCLELLDVVTLSENVMRGEKSCLTEITFHISGTMDLTCVGENPRLTLASSRWTKNIEGLIGQTDTSGQSVGGTEFWMVMDTAKNASTANETPTLINSLIYSQSTDAQKLAIFPEVHYTIDRSSRVTIYVYIDNQQVYSQTEIESKGRHSFGFSLPYIIDDGSHGEHQIDIYATCTPEIIERLSVNLPASGWTGSGPYMQTVNVSGLLSSDQFGPMYVEFTGDQLVDEARQAALAQISGAVTADGSVTFYCYNALPTTDIVVYADRSD